MTASAISRAAARVDRLAADGRTATLPDLREAGWRCVGRAGRDADAAARARIHEAAQVPFDQAAERAFAARRAERETKP